MSGNSIESGEQVKLQDLNESMNINLANNIGNLYILLASQILNLDNEYSSLISYLTLVNNDEDLKIEICGVLESAAASLAKLKSNYYQKRSLTQKFYDEEWRCMRLVLNIFEQQPQSKKEVHKLIKHCEVEDPRYL